MWDEKTGKEQGQKNDSSVIAGERKGMIKSSFLDEPFKSNQEQVKMITIRGPHTVVGQNHNRLAWTTLYPWNPTV